MCFPLCSVKEANHLGWPSSSMLKTMLLLAIGVGDQQKITEI